MNLCFYASGGNSLEPPPSQSLPREETALSPPPSRASDQCIPCQISRRATPQECSLRFLRDRVSVLQCSGIPFNTAIQNVIGGSTSDGWQRSYLCSHNDRILQTYCNTRHQHSKCLWDELQRSGMKCSGEVTGWKAIRGCRSIDLRVSHGSFDSGSDANRSSALRRSRRGTTGRVP